METVLYLILYTLASMGVFAGIMVFAFYLIAGGVVYVLETIAYLFDKAVDKIRGEHLWIVTDMYGNETSSTDAKQQAQLYLAELERYNGPRPPGATGLRPPTITNAGRVKK